MGRGCRCGRIELGDLIDTRGGSNNDSGTWYGGELVQNRGHPSRCPDLVGDHVK